MTSRGNFAQLLAPGIMHVMFEQLKEWPEEYSKFLKVETSDSAYDEEQQMAGLGLARLKREGEPITYDDPIQGGSKRFIHEAYALGWQVTKEMKDDEQYGLMKKIPGELTKSCRQTWEQVAANVLNLGASTVTGIDGATFFNTAHPLLGGGSYSNRLSPDADLSITALQDLLLLGEYMVNERGLRMQLGYTDLWIPPDLQFLAEQIFGSAQEPFTGENQNNVMKGRLNWHILHFLTDTNNYFLSTKGQNEAKFKWRVKPTVDSQDDFETKGTKHSIYFRVSAGVSEWRGWAASMP